METTKKILNVKEACELLGISKSYLYKLTMVGILPFSKPNGKLIFFEREKLEKWMLRNPSTPLSERQDEAATYVTTHQ